MASEETKMLFINATQAQEFKENKNDQNWALKELIGTLANILYENRSKKPSNAGWFANLLGAMEAQRYCWD